MVNNWINIIQDYWLPPTCILCDSPGYRHWDICFDCYNDLPRNLLCCPQCAAYYSKNEDTELICGDCLARNPAFDRTFGFFKHQHTIRYLNSQLKYQRQFKIARLFGLLLAEEISHQTDLPQAIIPVPLHPQRYRERRFNQSEEIGKTLAKQLHLPLLQQHCIRQLNTPHQTELSRRERHSNMRNAFKIVKPIPAQHVAILDDVLTTGSTLHELAKALKKSGVAKVDAWVVARAG